ncbi:hypothetical protein CROQUDRAFT_640200 [Cronartium quercuum f. sp. fusiforme G11]|uniref:Uncharacterized protein n=1 Tax=Cronartium quercuum f. sp. fusiforme G11 TaxID=708437 RepID=A0A9P6TB32_9BASI|nr:hypothetical protein CROQUDRAFT_640200 [Cronartium quercuum f. sp. fusiforme G11]
MTYQVPTASLRQIVKEKISINSFSPTSMTRKSPTLTTFLARIPNGRRLAVHHASRCFPDSKQLQLLIVPFVVGLRKRNPKKMHFVTIAKIFVESKIANGKTMDRSMMVSTLHLYPPFRAVNLASLKMKPQDQDTGDDLRLLKQLLSLFPHQTLKICSDKAKLVGIDRTHFFIDDHMIDGVHFHSFLFSSCKAFIILYPLETFDLIEHLTLDAPQKKNDCFKYVLSSCRM